MRIAVTGAAGAIGHALVPRLWKDPRVDGVSAVVRRRGTPVDERCDVVAIDVGSSDAVAPLARAFAGCDAVVHLAGRILPDKYRDQQRQTNVTGTANVVEAAERAGVNHLVHLSSAAVYSPKPGSEPVTEDWPTKGIDHSSFSQDKVAAEALLAAGPRNLRIGIVRAPVVMNGEGGVSRIAAAVLGRFAPLLQLTGGRVPIVFLPSGSRTQVVHADDVAEVIRLMLHRVSVGAFNVATDEVLDRADLARAAGGIGVPVPTVALRAAVSGLHRVGLVPVDDSWLDLLTTCPLLDATRATEELGWRPRFDAMAAVTAVPVPV